MVWTIFHKLFDQELLWGALISGILHRGHPLLVDSVWQEKALWATHFQLPCWWPERVLSLIVHLFNPLDADARQGSPLLAHQVVGRGIVGGRSHFHGCCLSWGCAVASTSVACLVVNILNRRPLAYSFIAHHCRCDRCVGCRARFLNLFVDPRLGVISRGVLLLVCDVSLLIAISELLRDWKRLQAQHRTQVNFAFQFKLSSSAFFFETHYILLFLKTMYFYKLKK